MDQNVVRTDLLPESMALWLVAALAVLGIVAWAACHWALKRHGTNRFNVWQRALLSLPLGVIATWLVLQAVARVVFLATPWSLFLGAVLGAVAVEAVCAFYTHECARVPPRTARALVACRLTAVAIAFMVLMQPVVIGERERTVARRVLVMVDDSASMHFKDGQLSDAERQDLATALGLERLPEEGMTRAEMIRALVAAGGDEGFLAKVSRKFQVDVFRFGNGIAREETIGQERELDAREALFRSVTDVTRALELAIKEVPAEEIASIILFTDGRHNGDAGVESIARKLGGFGIPVSSVIVGGTVRPFDLSIAAADSPESVFLGDKVRFTASVRATQANGRAAKLKLYAGKELVDSRDFTVEGDDWTKEFKFTDVPKDGGVYRYRLEVSYLDGELFRENNARDLDVAVSDDRTNVLLVDSRPRWEYRYLRNLFYGRDKSVHLQDWLVRPDTIADIKSEPLPYASASRPFGESEAGGFPFTREEWRKFDVIIIGDLGEDVLDFETIDSIRYCVEERGSLLVLISGSESMPMSIRSETLRRLIPVEYDPDGASHRAAPEESFAFTLTSAGRGHPVMNQSSSASENEDIWRDRVPEFHWRLPVKGVKPGAEVLAYARPHKPDGDSGAAAIAESIAATIEQDPEAAMRRLEEMRGEQSRNALVVATSCGKGRVLMLTTDSMWRLRSKQGDALHHRFWGQVMRWGAGERMRTGNAYVRIGTDQLRYGAGEPISAYVRILDERHNGLDNLAPRLVVRELQEDGSPAKGKGWAFYPVQRENANGFYECTMNGFDRPGTYSITLECPKAGQALGAHYPPNLETRFVVVTTKQPAEEVDITATREAAERMAKVTGGRVLSPSEYVGMTDDFGGGSKRVEDRVEYPLWSLPPLFLLALGLLTVEWVLRKRSSLA